MKLKRTTLLFICSFLSIALFSQEICNNGIDDDNDGQIDLNDDDCVCESFMPSSLIPNPSFEEMTCCPMNEAQLFCADDWIQASSATTDYVHTCGPYLGLAFINAVAPQPFPDGEGGIGFRDGKPGSLNFKEYTGACLMEPLQAGENYMLDFFIGFRDNVEGSMNLEMAVFASMDCGNIPFGAGNPDFGCPTNGPGFVLLGEMEYSGSNEWVNATFEFTPDQDYNVIVLGPACTINENAELDPYFYFDNIVLAQANEFGLPIVEVTGAPCGDMISLQSSEDIQGEYQWYKDGIAIIGETSSSITITDPSDPLDPQNGIYQVVVTTDTGCFLGDEYLLEFTTFESMAEAEICAGDTIIIGNEVITEAEMYSITLQSVITQCDSLVTLIVTEGDMPEENIEASICAGAVYEINGIEYDEAGSFTQTIERDNACDSLVTLELMVMATDTTFDSGSYCAGGSVIVGGVEYDDAGEYIQELTGVAGCDSTVLVEITELPAETTDQSASFCEGSSIIIGGEEFTEAGNFTQTFTNQEGCDSIINLTLTTLATDSTSVETTVCPGESVLIGGEEYTEPGIYTQAFTNQAGCDSILTIILDRENGCIDCDLTEDGNFKTKVEITRMETGGILLQINQLQSLEITEDELEDFVRTFAQEQENRELHGALRALNKKAPLTKDLISKYQRPQVLTSRALQETQNTMETVKAMKSGRTMRYWISI